MAFIRFERVATKICFVIAAALLLHSFLYAYIATQHSCSVKPSITVTESSFDTNTATGNSKQRFNSTVRLPTVCIYELCRSEYVRQLRAKDSHPIPAIRHILWRNESVSEYFAEQLRSWQRIHPDWTYVLWRDRDLEPFVVTHFPGLLAKFKSLPRHIMRVDMIRYMLLFKYGGVYADLDYSLVGDLSDIRHFHAVVTREPEAHTLAFLSTSWPIRVLASPAFLMSAPGHIFFHYVARALDARAVDTDLTFAGPFGLTDILEKYTSQFPIANNALEAVYVPPSHSFYPYPRNRLSGSKSAYLAQKIAFISAACKSIRQKDPKQQQWKQDHPLRQYCADVNNMDPITDKSQPVFAIHDLNKDRAAYDSAAGTKFYSENLIDVRRVIPKLKLGSDFMRVG